ncbi:MAG: LytR C-terminal domain-containing protein [Actinomycetota bacterium]
MTGRHEPGSNRSFYLSVATSTLRLLITAALVLGGVTLINQAFPDSPGGSSADGGSSPTASPPPEESPTPTASPSESQAPIPSLSGVRIIVLNGTSVSGLAGTASDDLVARFGVVAATPGNTASRVNQTEVYYRSADLEEEAQYLVLQFFEDLNVRVQELPPNTPGVPANVDIAVYLGTDFASL